jgi:hypothetical protein
MHGIRSIFVVAVITASSTGAFAQPGGAAGGAAPSGVNAGSGVSGHPVGSPSAGNSGKLGSSTAPKVQQQPTQPGCPGSSLPSTTPGMKPPC